MKRHRFAAAIGIGILVSSTPTEAGVVYASRNVMGSYGTNFYTGGTLGDWPSDFNGQMIMTLNEGDSPGLPTYERFIWCIDQLGYIGLGDNPSPDNTGIVYTVGTLSDFTTDFNGNSITQRQARQIAALATLGDRMLRKGPDNVLANAVQAAITNIEYGTTSDGGAEVNAKTVELMTWATGLSDDELSGYNALVYRSAPGTQAVLSALVPEPRTLALALLGVGLAGLRLLRRRPR